MIGHLIAAITTASERIASTAEDGDAHGFRIAGLALSIIQH
jgi:hypothetical protein